MPRKQAAIRAMAVAPNAMNRIGRAPSVGIRSSSVLRNASVSVSAPIRISTRARASTALPRPAIRCGMAQLRADSVLVSVAVASVAGSVPIPVSVRVGLALGPGMLAVGPEPGEGVAAQPRRDGLIIAPDLVELGAGVLQLDGGLPHPLGRLAAEQVDHATVVGVLGLDRGDPAPDPRLDVTVQGTCRPLVERPVQPFDQLPDALHDRAAFRWRWHVERHGTPAVDLREAHVPGVAHARVITQGVFPGVSLVSADRPLTVEQAVPAGQTA